MKTPGLYIDGFGKVNHHAIPQLPDSELLEVCQLHGMPLGFTMLTQLAKRGLLPEFNDLINRAVCLEDH